MITVTSLYFAGDCEAAFKLYEQCFGGTIAVMLRWGESPMAAEVSPEWHDKLVFARLKLDGVDLTGGDLPPHQYRQPQGFALTISVGDLAEGERIFATLAEGGEVKVPMQETFWAARYGFVVDRFGIPWEVNCDKPH